MPHDVRDGAVGGAHVERAVTVTVQHEASISSSVTHKRSVYIPATSGVKLVTVVRRTPPTVRSKPAPFEAAYDYVYDSVVAPYAEPSRDKLLPDLPTHLQAAAVK